MLAWGFAAVLCLALVCQGVLLRRKIRAFEAQQARLDQTLAESAQALDAQKTLTAQQQEANQALLASLAEKEAALAELTPKPKLYLPDEEESHPEEPQEPIVYYNENTGIYHADRFCAPYQAIETLLSQVPPRARPCKKCAEGVLPPALLPADPPQEEENQLSLFGPCEIE